MNEDCCRQEEKPRSGRSINSNELSMPDTIKMRAMLERESKRECRSSHPLVRRLREIINLHDHTVATLHNNELTSEEVYRMERDLEQATIRSLKGAFVNN